MTGIGAAQASNPDEENPQWTDDDFAKSRPALAVMRDVFGVEPVGQTSHGSGSIAKKVDGRVSTTLKLDADVLDAYRRDGRGWQSRMNQVLREHMPDRK